MERIEREYYGPTVEVRAGTDGGASYLGGYAAVFGQETIIAAPGGVRWRERVSPKAFDAAIQGDDVIAAVNHDYQKVLGRSKSGTLVLSVDAHGLRYDVKLPNTTLARDTVESVRRGDYAGSSFKFIVPEGGARVAKPAGRSADDLPLVIIERVQLIDVGPVTFPAYEGTSVSARSVLGVVADFLKQAGDDEIAIRERTSARVSIARARAWGS